MSGRADRPELVNKLKQYWTWYLRLCSRYGKIKVNTTAAVLIILSIAAGAFVYWDKVKTIPGAASAVEWLTRKPLPKADPGRFTVLVANLESDPGGERKKNILISLARIKGIDVEPLDKCGLP